MRSARTIVSIVKWSCAILFTVCRGVRLYRKCPIFMIGAHAWIPKKVSSFGKVGTDSFLQNYNYGDELRRSNSGECQDFRNRCREFVDRLNDIILDFHLVSGSFFCRLVIAFALNYFYKETTAMFLCYSQSSFGLWRRVEYLYLMLQRPVSRSLSHLLWK